MGCNSSKSGKTPKSAGKTSTIGQNKTVDTEEDRAKAKSMFQRYDKSGDHNITFAEFMNLMKDDGIFTEIAENEGGADEKQSDAIGMCREFFDTFDSNKTDGLSEDEFIELYLYVVQRYREERKYDEIKSAFDVLDADQSGKINLEEFGELLSRCGVEGKLDESRCRQILAESGFDLNGDQRIDFKEFTRILKDIKG